MQTDNAALTDQVHAELASTRVPADRASIHGRGTWELHGPDGELKATGEFVNLVTQVGDQYYGERAAGVAGAPAAATGMQLGTGTTAPSKTGAGASIGTLVASSLVALSAAPVSSLNGSSRRIAYSVQWAAGVATANAISEVALVNQATSTQTVAPASATVSRALLNPTVNKGNLDTLTVNWNHDLLGA